MVLTESQNVDNAQKEIDRLEAEASAAGPSDSARKPAAVNGSASAGAEKAQEKDAVADATKDLESAKIEDNTAAESTA